MSQFEAPAIVSVFAASDSFSQGMDLNKTNKPGPKIQNTGRSRQVIDFGHSAGRQRLFLSSLNLYFAALSGKFI